MPDRIGFPSRAAQLADLIEKDLQSGLWADRLPGVRPLSQRYGVSIKTCRDALYILEQEDRIAPAMPGQRRSILPSGPARMATAKENKLLLIVHPVAGSWGASGNELLHKAEYTWSRFQGDVVWKAVDFARIKRPGGALDAMIDCHKPHAILLAMPGPQWTRETGKRLPFYQMGGPHESDSPISYSAFSLIEEISKVALLLRQLGHRRILIPQQWGVARMRAHLVDTVRLKVGREPDFGRWEDYCPDFSENVPEVWTDYWDRCFKNLRPTAVVLFEDTHLFSFYGFCYTNGIRIPEDVSVICLDDQKLFEWCKPRPTFMRFPERASTAHFRKWVTGGLKPIGRKFFDLQMVEGDSVAPPAQGL